MMNWLGRDYRLQWVGVAFVLFTTVMALYYGYWFWGIVGAWAGCVMIFPALYSGDVRRTLPLELVVLLSIPFVLFWLFRFGYNVTSFWAVDIRWIEVIATVLVAFVTVMDLHIYTDLVMNRLFAILLTVMLSLTVASFFAIADGLVAYIGGVHALPDEKPLTELMFNFIYAFIGGLAMGIVLDYYLRSMSKERLSAYGICQLGEVKE